MRHSPHRVRSVALVALVVTVVLVSTGVTTRAARGLAGAARAPRTVTLVTHDSFAASKKVLAAFTERTGITVKVLQAGDAGQVVNQAILTKDDPLGDVLFGVDNTFLTRALDAGIFERYRSPALADVAPELRLDPSQRVTPIDYGDVCINFDKEWFASRDIPVPTSLDDLTKARYRDLLVVEDPSTSSPGLAFMLATIAEYGTGGWTEYWDRLRANGVRVVDGWEQAYYDEFTGGGAGGGRPLVVSYASSPAAAVVFADPPIDRSPIGTMTASCFRQVEFAGILAGTEHRAEARSLVDFLLSERFQADVPLQMFVYPARTDVPLPPVFTENSTIVTDPYTMTPSRIGARREQWVRTWTGTVLR
ncbi:MAG: thiamine ABC transporter substrate binding subunit [Actinomycetota bacterium]